MNFEGVAEDLQVSNVNGIYPTIDPTSAYTTKSYQGKVVLITGATGIIGAAIAQTYAQAGASVVLVGRNPSALEKVKEEIIKAGGTGDDILTVQVDDITNPKAAESAVDQAVRKFGRLDIVVANAGSSSGWGKPLGETDPDAWWNCIDVNLRGVYNIVRYSLPYIIETKGYVVAITALAAQLRIPLSSAYSISKHALNRFVEFVQLEHPEIHTFSLHPGKIHSPLSVEAMTNGTSSKEEAELYISFLSDAPELPACTLLYLTSGKADWLSGRYVSANWDLGQVESKYKTKIIENKLLVNRLSVPS